MEYTQVHGASVVITITGANIAYLGLASSIWMEGGMCSERTVCLQ
jgi:hypothetical protein